jgi:hypothetical protein
MEELSSSSCCPSWSDEQTADVFLVRRECGKSKNKKSRIEKTRRRLCTWMKLQIWRYAEELLLPLLLPQRSSFHLQTEREQGWMLREDLLTVSLFLLSLLFLLQQ